MLRASLTTLLLLLALVPPGVCQCRLEAMLSMDCPSHHEEHEDGDDHDSCDCGQLKPDCLTSEPPPDTFAPAPCGTLALTQDVWADETFTLHSVQLRNMAAGTPLYLALRALRI